jgi:Protein of unknown function (DUF3168)
MKDIRSALRFFLLADATVASLVGGSNPTTARIFPILMPQDEKNTSLVYNRITEVSDYHLLGSSHLEQTRMQIDAWAMRPGAASELADAVYDRLSGHAGTVVFGSNSPQDFIEFRGVFMVSGREDYDGTAELFRMSRDYLIWYMGV